MRCERVNVTVKRNVVSTIARSVFAHEVPILQAMWGFGNVHWERSNEPSQEIKEKAEYERLQRSYGQQQETQMPWCTLVYGNLMERRLGQAMKGGIKFLEEMELPDEEEAVEDFEEDEVPPATEVEPVIFRNKSEVIDRLKHIGVDDDQIDETASRAELDQLLHTHTAAQLGALGAAFDPDTDISVLSGVLDAEIARRSQSDAA